MQNGVQNDRCVKVTGALAGAGSPGFLPLVPARLLHDTPAGEFDRGPS